MTFASRLYVLISTNGQVLYEYQNSKGKLRKAIFKSEKELHKCISKTPMFDKIYKKNKRRYGKPCKSFHLDLEQMGYTMAVVKDF